MMIQKSTLILATFIFAGMISCNSASDSETTAIENTTAVEAAPIATPPSELENALSAPAMTTAPAQNLAINPPHGQPGHDCAVAVGAPLTGSVAAPSVAPMPVPAAMPSTPIGASTPRFNANANLNPAHGQPGHDCAVAVGAPLPSR